MARKHSRKATRKTRRRSVKGGGLGENSATWAPDKSSFGPKIGSPENTENLIGFGTKGGKRRKTKKVRRRYGGDPIPDRNQFEAQTAEVKDKSSPVWKGTDTNKTETKMGQYDMYKAKPQLKK
jgi:hypothetical protein